MQDQSIQCHRLKQGLLISIRQRRKKVVFADLRRNVPINAFQLCHSVIDKLQTRQNAINCLGVAFDDTRSRVALTGRENRIECHTGTLDVGSENVSPTPPPPGRSSLLVLPWACNRNFYFRSGNQRH